MARAGQLGQAQLLLHEPAGDRVLTVETSAPLELAYARHVYKAQGMTAEVANVATGPSTTQECLYVMVSRSRERTRIHALRAEVEEMGSEPAHLEPPQPHVSVDAPQAAEYLVEAPVAEPAASSLIVAQDQAQRDRLLGLLQERQQAQQAEQEATRGRSPRA
jgi:hypothetical protein